MTERSAIENATRSASCERLQRRLDEWLRELRFNRYGFRDFAPFAIHAVREQMRAIGC